MIDSINPSAGFVRQFKKITKNNPQLKEDILETIQVLKIDPFSHILRSHKVSAKIGGLKWSSRVNGNIRIIWDFNGKYIKIIELYDIGTHSGSNKVYK